MATSIAQALGMRDLPRVVYPGHLNEHSAAQLEENIVQYIAGPVVQALTETPIDAKARVTEDAVDPRAIIFKGSFEEVNDYFLKNEWSDGLPVVPPTIDKVEEFLKHTNRDPDDVLGIAQPDNREATVWSIAVNGVMAGCRPEYMPVLVAIVEAMLDPMFGHEHLGHTPGTEVLITLNGPIIKELGFNFGQGALRVGYQANTSVGRFWRLYLRNVAGFLHGRTDKATFGGTWRVVLAENEDFLREVGWPPMSVDQGFQAGDNVVTINSCTSTDSVFSVAEPDPRQLLDKLAARLVDIQLYFYFLNALGPSVRPQILLSPLIVKHLARHGYAKQDVKQYLFQKARFSPQRYQVLFPDTDSSDATKAAMLKKVWESVDADGLVPVVSSPDDILLTVSGDPNRDNCLICAQNGFIGYPVSKKITLP